MEEGPGRGPTVPGYEVLDPLGQGASATVWRARRLADRLVVALKVLTPAGGDVAAGLREAGLLASVRHRHVVRLHDVLPLPDPATGRPEAVALAMQLAGGGSLAQVLARRRILSAGELVTALQPVAGALADLHGQGVVHGDLSTGNVLFLRDGMPLLADLGAARITGAEPGDPQGTGAVAGLVAPEVLEGFAPTPESDVYQLGAIAWLCLCGEPPGLAWRRGPLEELAPGLPAGLADLVTQCLAPEPADRPDAEEVALVLLATATPQPVEVAPEADPGHGLTERLRRQARADLGPEGEPEERGRRRGRVASWVGALQGWGASREPRPGDDRRGTHRPERVAGAAGGPREGRDRTRLLLVAAAALVLVVVAAVSAPVVGTALADLARGVGSGEVVAPAGGPSTPVDLRASAEPSSSADRSPSVEPSGPADPAVAARAPQPGASDGERQVAARSPGRRDAQDHVTAVLQGLVDGRARAWSAGDPGLLEQVMAPGSPALGSEVVAVGRARDEGLRYPAVAFRVEDAGVVDETERRLTVDAMVSRDPLRGVGDEGELKVEEPASTEEVRFVLTRTGANDPWRVWSWATGQSDR